MIDTRTIEHLIEIETAQALIDRLRAPVADTDVGLFVSGANRE